MMTARDYLCIITSIFKKFFGLFSCVFRVDEEVFSNYKIALGKSMIFFRAINSLEFSLFFTLLDANYSCNIHQSILTPSNSAKIEGKKSSLSQFSSFGKDLFCACFYFHLLLFARCMRKFN